MQWSRTTTVVAGVGVVFAAVGAVVAMWPNQPPASDQPRPSPGPLILAKVAWKTKGSDGTPLSRFAPPPNSKRVDVAPGTFGAWLRELPLRPHGTQVKLHNNMEKERKVAAAVVDIDTGDRDLQQCADAVMRLRAEFLWAKNRSGDICFRPVQGAGQIRFLGGSHEAFRAWLNNVFNRANTDSLRNSLDAVADGWDVQAGDVYVDGHDGKKMGHAVIVLDVAVETKSVREPEGVRWVQLAQSYMPAQDIEVLQNGQFNHAWFRANRDGSIFTPEWAFKPGALRRFGAKDCGP